MITLDSALKSLEVVLSGAITTNQLPFTAGWLDSSTATFGLTGISEGDGNTNSTTAVTVVAAPGASTTRQVKSLSIQNADTVAATVTLRANNNAVLRTLCVVTLQVNETLFYMDGDGFMVMDATGNIKGTASTATTIPFLTFVDQSTPPTPSAGRMELFSNAQFIKAVDAAGTLYNLSGGNFLQANVITANVTYTTPVGVHSIIVECLGAGGGGAGANGTLANTGLGSGGAAGAYAKKIILTPNTTYAVVVGIGGIGGANATSAATAGSNTTFGATVIVTQGGAAGTNLGQGTAANVTLGGAATVVATGGDINDGGEGGGYAIRLAALVGVSGRGGSTPLGAGGNESFGSTGGVNGIGFGSGGSGASGIGNVTSRAGGNGAPGICIVYEFS